MMGSNPVLTIETDDYTGDATSASLTAESTTQQTRTLKPTTVVSDTTPPLYTFNVTVVQGSDLHELLLDTAPGDLLSVVYQLEPGTGKRKATFEVRSQVPNFGGEPDQTLLAEVALAVDGAVTWGVSS